MVAWAGAGPYRTRRLLRGRRRALRLRRPARTRRRRRPGGPGGLIRAYEARGFWKLVSRIFPENEASLALHERAGFAWSASTGGMAGSTASGATASSWRRLLGEADPRLTYTSGTPEGAMKRPAALASSFSPVSWPASVRHASRADEPRLRIAITPVLVEHYLEVNRQLVTYSGSGSVGPRT